jgi:hypothetical protein
MESYRAVNALGAPPRCNGATRAARAWQRPGGLCRYDWPLGGCHRKERHGPAADERRDDPLGEGGIVIADPSDR